ncbi:hypothetical protein [Azospirillum aestuarii]|uniref:hypothetical protein n=1 Tax=Azospirillum aestuarii TaxID=2802052 RepID=UPI00405504EC
MSNLPCNGCFWIEGGRCFQDKLAHVHGLEKAPRIGSPEPYGLEITDALITECVERGGYASKAAIYGKFKQRLRDAGIEVISVCVTPSTPSGET